MNTARRHRYQPSRPGTRTLDYFHNGGFFRALKAMTSDGVFQRNLAPGSSAIPALYGICQAAGKSCQVRRICGRQHKRFSSGISSVAQGTIHLSPLPGFSRSRSRHCRVRLLISSNNTPSTRCASSAPILSFWRAIWRGSVRKAGSRRSGRRALKIAETGKTVQFQVARAVNRKKFDTLASAMSPEWRPGTD